MIHNVRTSNGDSKGTFKATDAFGGSGQESGGSPPLCHSQLVVMVATMEQLTPGQFIQDPRGAIILLQHVINWVDDTVNKEILHRDEDMQVQLHRIRKILLHWRRILRITGGDLELSKTVVYYLNHIQEEDGKMRFKTIQETPGDIIMPAETESEKDIKIDRNESDKAERYLGVRIALSGQMVTELNFRCKHSKDLSVKLGQIYMTCPAATLAYQSRWLSIVGFFTTITCFTQNQCEGIHTPIYQVFLPKMGHNRNLPLAIRYEPKRYGGANLTHTYTEQVIKHIQFVVGTARHSSELSNMQLIALSTIQI